MVKRPVPAVNATNCWRPSDDPKTHQPMSIEVNGTMYFIDATSWHKSTQHLDVLLMQGSNTKSVVLKVFKGSMRAHGIDENRILSQLRTHMDSKKYVGETIGFSDNVTFDNQNCCVLVMHKGEHTLQQLVTTVSANQVRIYENVFIKQVAESLFFLHAQGRVVHGALRLENVVDFGQQVPDAKLVNFDKSCRLNSTMMGPWNPGDNAEYCPPELAEQIVSASQQQNQQKDTPSYSLRADGSFDVWCFGVLWLKYLMNGEVLPEFQDMSSNQILEQIAQPGFCFAQSLKKLRDEKVANIPTRDLIASCTRRDPMTRPTMCDILESHVIQGVDNQLMKRYKRQNELNTIAEEMERLGKIIHTMVITEAKCELPCLWVLVPWEDKRQELDKTIDWPWSSLGGTDMELLLLCDATLDGGSQSSCSADYLERNRLRVPQGPGFVTTALPLLKASALVLKIANALNCLLHVPGIGAASNLVSLTADHCAQLDWAQKVLARCAENNEQDKEIADRIDELTRLATKADDDQSIDRQAIATNLQQQSDEIRSRFESGAKQQLKLELLRIMDNTKHWHEQRIVGGLEQICDRSGRYRWVCPDHAKCLGKSEA